MSRTRSQWLESGELPDAEWRDPSYPEPVEWYAYDWREALLDYRPRHNAVIQSVSRRLRAGQCLMVREGRRRQYLRAVGSSQTTPSGEAVTRHQLRKLRELRDARGDETCTGSG